MTRGSQTYFYTMDGLGSVRDLTDAAQSIVEQYDYDSFGNLTAPPTTGNPYTYTSREYDPETGMLFYRARYYDPKVGRFLQQDPKGFDGGDVNFYAYVANNPINWIDPYGFKKDDPTYGYPDDFWNWYHENWKYTGDRDATKDEAEEAYEEWQRQGEPKPKKDKDKRRDNENSQSSSWDGSGISSEGYWRMVAVEVCGVVTWYLIYVAPYTPVLDPY
jgi:RHS repeat-associated protein